MILSDMRKRIDEIDDEILRLLNKRASIVTDIAKHKKACGLPILDGKRFDEIIARAIKRNTGPLSNEDIHLFFEEMLELFEVFEESPDCVKSHQ